MGKPSLITLERVRPHNLSNFVHASFLANRNACIPYCVPQNPPSTSSPRVSADLAAKNETR
jgi:hypothetical protein